jgi:glycosyltransferase involved in cell wall biosynthesis
MRVSLIRGALDSPSIIQYADQIVQKLRTYHPEIAVTQTRPPSLSSIPFGRIGRGAATHIVRYGWYPMRARSLPADIHHITDHVHAYMVRHLESERTVVTCHDLTTFVHPENISQTSLFPSITSRVFRHSIGRLHEAAAVIAVSENTKKDILRYSQCRPEQVHVVYHGVDAAFSPDADRDRVLALRKSLAPDGSRLLLHVGLTTPYKNIETVVWVVHLLSTHMNERVRLVKVGQAFTASQQQLIRQLGLDDRVVHLGRLEPTELITCYQSCDVLLFPSIYEGFGWPPLEAMACGTPVVASRAGSIPEIVGDAGVLEEPRAADKLARAVANILANEQLRKNLIAAGLRRAAQFSWQRSIARLVNIYEDVLRLAHAGRRRPD